MQGNDLRDDEFLPQVSCMESCKKLLGNGFLLLAVVENCRTILCAYIRTLPVQCCGVMYREENLQDFPIRYP